MIGSNLNNNSLCLDWPPDELYLPPMRKIDSILSEQKRRLLRRVSMSSQHQVICPACPVSLPFFLSMIEIGTADVMMKASDEQEIHFFNSNIINTREKR